MITKNPSEEIFIGKEYIRTASKGLSLSGRLILQHTRHQAVCSFPQIHLLPCRKLCYDGNITRGKERKR